MKQFTVLGASLVIACGGEPPAPPIVQDSSGVTIVHNFGPSWTSNERWYVDDAPFVDIGAGTAPEYQLSRVIRSTRLDNGTIVVADGGTQDLRWYDANGNHVISVKGSTTFSRVEWIGRLGSNSVMVFDFGNLRLSLFDGTGELQQTGTLVVTFQASPSSVKGVFADSSVLAVRDVKSWAPTMIRSGDAPEGLVRGPAAAFRYSADGTFMDNVGTFLGAQRIFSKGQSRFVRVTPPPFGRTAVFTVSNDHFYVGAQDKYEVSVFNLDGSLNAIVKLEHENTPTTEANIDRYKRARLAGVHELQKEDRERELNALPFPETMPAYGPIEVDLEGNLWVADARPFGDEPNRWTVFGTDYRMLGVVDTPHDFTIHEIGGDYVLGSVTEDDMDHVRVYRLVKPT